MNAEIVTIKYQSRSINMLQFIQSKSYSFFFSNLWSLLAPIYQEMS